jgi:Leucine-rich repeat (LRR) protein
MKPNIKIDLPNLNYLDLRLNKVEDVIGIKFGYIDLFDNLKKLKDIFNFDSLSVFTPDEKYIKNNNKFFPGKEIDYTFQKPDLLFQEKYLKQFEYFKLNISYGFLTGSGQGIEEKYIVSRKYLFSQTKSDKYLFRTI